jgi:hypothetical protein
MLNIKNYLKTIFVIFYFLLLSCGKDSQSSVDSKIDKKEWFRFNEKINGKEFDINANVFHDNDCAGVVLYKKIGDKTFVLFGEEKAGGLWNFIQRRTRDNKPFISIALRGLKEEGFEGDIVKTMLLKNSHYDVYKGAYLENYACTFFLEIDFIEKIEKVNKDNYKGKFKSRIWVNLENLKLNLERGNLKKTESNQGEKAYEVEVILENGSQKSIEFYDYPWHILTQASKKGIFEKF